MVGLLDVVVVIVAGVLVVAVVGFVVVAVVVIVVGFVVAAVVAGFIVALKFFRRVFVIGCLTLVLYLLFTYDTGLCVTSGFLLLVGRRFWFHVIIKDLKGFEVDTDVLDLSDFDLLLYIDLGAGIAKCFLLLFGATRLGLATDLGGGLFVPPVRAFLAACSKGYRPFPHSLPPKSS